MNTLILAIGNPQRGDDGVGSAILDALSAYDLPEDVSLYDGGTLGLEMVLLFQQYPRVIILDAAEMAQVGGTWRRFSPEEVRAQTRDMHLRGTMHYAGLAEALTLAEGLGLLPEHIEIFGVQPSLIDWDEGLSEAVRAVVPQVAQAVYSALTEMLDLTWASVAKHPSLA